MDSNRREGVINTSSISSQLTSDFRCWDSLLTLDAMNPTMSLNAPAAGCKNMGHLRRRASAS